MKNLLFIVFLLITSVTFSQSVLTDRINYEKFNKKLFDSLLLDEVNTRRINMKLPPFIFDSICHQSANYQSRMATKKNICKLINDTELDGVLLKTGDDRFEYFNSVNQVNIDNEKKLEAELITGIQIGKESKTFTYPRLVKFVLDNYLSDGDELLYREFGTLDIFSAFSTELKSDDNVYNIFITCDIAIK